MNDQQAEKKRGEWWNDGAAGKASKPVTTPGSLEDALTRLNRMAVEAGERRGRLEIWLAGQPQTIACPNHSNRILRVDLDKSLRATLTASETEGKETFRIEYEKCLECLADGGVEKLQRNWLARAGVPSILHHASFKTFNVESDEDRFNLSEAKKFVEVGKGTLIMLGNRGDGKSFLSVAVMREFGGGKYVTQNNLLLDLRRGYGNDRAEDVILTCQRTKCLVIDNFGLSMGGKDELPMLQSIMDERHGEKRPSVITSTLTLEQLYTSLGADLKSRIRQSTFRVLQFTGADSRPEQRQSYFAED